MATVFWTGKLSPVIKVMVDISNALAWITGNARDTAAMKWRMKLGYEGTCTDDVTRYDDLGLEYYTKAAKALLEGSDLRGKEALDVGCATGILSLLALDQGAAKVVCGDLSQYMLDQCRKKATEHGYGPDRIDFRQLDAESLPFDDNSFEVVVSGMTLGLLPEQKKAVSEMIRVVRPGGTLALSTHGSDYYAEAIDAAFRTVPKRYVLGYRIEFWPRKEEEIQRMLAQAGFVDVRTRRLTWQDGFETGGKAYDFFAATSAAWWLVKFPPNKTAEVSQKTRDFFERKRVTQITKDIIVAYGRKP